MKSYYIIWAFTGLNTWIWSSVFHTRDLPFTEKLDYFSAALTILYSLYYSVIRLSHLYPSQQRARLTLATKAPSSPERSLKLKAWSLLCVVVYVCHVSYLTLLPRFDYAYNITFNLVIGLSHNALWLLYSLPSSISVFRRFPGHPRSYRPAFVTKAGIFVGLTTAATALELLDFPPLKGIIDAHSLWHLATAPIAVLCFLEMIGKSLPEYIFIRLCIAGLRLVAPVSVIYLLACAATGRVIVSPILVAAAACEAIFYAFFFFRCWRFNKTTSPGPPRLTRAQRQDLFERSTLHFTAENLSGWFIPPKSEIKRDNLREWILWAMFASTPEHASPEWDEEIDQYILATEKKLGCKLEPGRVPGVQSLRLSFDPIYTLHRPLIWYIVRISLLHIVGIVDAFTSLCLLSLGFKHYAPRRPYVRAFPPRPLLYLLSKPAAAPYFPYWYRPPRPSVESKNPILFLHGIGIGLYPYVPLLQEILRADSSQSMVLVEFLPVSFRMTGPMPTRWTTLEALNNILEDLDISKVTLAAHSYGTFIAGHIVSPPPDAEATDDPALSLGDKVSALVLVDPIPFLLHLPTVAYNFLYRPPGPYRGNEWQLWYFASRDADVARVLGRCFFWEEGCIWREDLRRFGATNGRRVSVILGGGDQIVPSEAVREYLTSDDEGDWRPTKECERWQSRRERLEVIWFPGLDHATVFETKERRKMLMQALNPPHTSYGAVESF
ncbi:AB hydrolase-1 domain-containing protein [Favolaschia claudopus]|uniref:AB hydrolase-1 domain-containing protein n=1 Tax=Favolaschia claudopus TaxID=2862362 RepID=A0AAW0CAG4_9AGAR